MAMNVAGMIVDTNFLIYKTDKPHKRVKGDQKKLQHNAYIRIANKIWEDFDKQNIRLYLPNEVIRETEVHEKVPSKYNPSQITKMHTIKDELKERIVEGDYTLEREHRVRLLSAYLKKFGVRTPSGKIIHYPGVSDARLIITALDAGLGIATGDVDDFLLFAVLGYTLFDVVNNQCITIPKEDLNKIKEDPFFIECEKIIKNNNV
ncbi:hypothetical protein BIV60_11415 [Bacillus sp. MUM 116]|uniref:hypothetical protein n=1 Tax=Bacillus sp. MUM 116 TaxID=1678002 RepID=UPI0008F5EB1E|nr:hypothetical protein [Bacillus sp. MUM 116]OIK14568.1 hypothetical protein BIV60_11415 [Bacillus sp. MUM 116]